MMTALQTLRDALAALPGVATCKVGLEPNIGPADYPLVRIVPSRITPGAPYHKRSAECLIYFGAPIVASEGTEAVYSALFDLEAAIIGVLKSAGHRYTETITDEDRLDTYKLMTIRCTVMG